MVIGGVGILRSGRLVVEWVFLVFIFGCFWIRKERIEGGGGYR